MQDESFAAALTMDGWNTKPSCFKFLERQLLLTGHAYFDFHANLPVQSATARRSVSLRGSSTPAPGVQRAPSTSTSQRPPSHPLQTRTRAS